MAPRTPGTARRRAAACAAAIAAVALALALLSGGDPAPAASPAAPREAAASAPPAAAAPPPAVVLLPPAAAPARPLPAAAPGPEEQLMDRLRAEVDERPEAAVALAEQGDAAFPAGRHGDERAYLHMRALVHLGDIGKARTIAGEFFERYPESPLGRTVFRLTGMRPRPPIGPAS